MSEEQTEVSKAPSGALETLARDDASRKHFLKTVGAGGAGAFALLLAACGGSDKKKTTSSAAPAAAGTGGNDVEIVNYALTLEYLEAAFYKDVVASGLFKGAELDTIKTFGDQEQQHVDALTAAVKKLGGTPAAKPQTKFPLDNAASVLKLAASVENLGAAAYLGQVAKIQNKEILAAALSIHTVEGRHAAALNTLMGVTIVPDGAFAKPASMDEVMSKVKPFIVG